VRVGVWARLYAMAGALATRCASDAGKKKPRRLRDGAFRLEERGSSGIEHRASSTTPRRRFSH